MTTTIAFAENLLPLVEDGRKSITISKGKREYAEVLTVTDPGGAVQPYQIKVNCQYQYPASLILERHIQMDGFLDLEDMVEGMQSFYPDFGPDTDCTVVLFERIPNPSR